MKNIVFLYADFNNFLPFEKEFAAVSAFDRTLIWANGIEDCACVYVACNSKNEEDVQLALKNSVLSKYKIIVQNEWDVEKLFDSMAEWAQFSNAQNVIYTMADRPFLDNYLTKEIIKTHTEFLAEYTYSDGYPDGFSPEMLNLGSIKIIASLLKTDDYKILAAKKVDKNSIFEVLKKDINSYEIETVIADDDFRMLRFDFSCSTKYNLTSCKKLYEEALTKKIPFTSFELSTLALNSSNVQLCVPSFYSIQISTKKSSSNIYTPDVDFSSMPQMSLEQFKALINQISETSGTAVVDLSFFGEPLLNEKFCDYVKTVLSYPELSVMIETDGIHLTKKIVEETKEILQRFPKSKSLYDRIIWIVKLDAVTETMYNKIVDGGNFNAAQDAVNLLSDYFKDSVYPQFTRTLENEEELEKFYRHWHDKNSPSGGKVVIQKFDDWCKKLPAKKVCDLSPVTRFPCWHLKRDMYIFSDGSVPLCKGCYDGIKFGNVFEEGIEKIFKKRKELLENHIAGNYPENCGDCDEYYTFNF